MARKEIKAPEEEGCALWVVTFGDAMSLLVAFFVMLVSFADFEEHALQETFGALKGGLRAVPMPLAVAMGKVPRDKLDTEPKSEPEDPELSNKNLMGHTDRNVVKTSSSEYYVHLLANGISIVINREAIFEPGTATFKDVNHEVWTLARDLMQSVRNEVRVSATLPENIMVRIGGYSTAWGLGIEQSLAVQELLAKDSRTGYGQISTSVRVVKSMPRNTPSNGMVEIVFVGFSEMEMKGIPGRILKETWRKTSAMKKGANDGKES